MGFERVYGVYRVCRAYEVRSLKGFIGFKRVCGVYRVCRASKRVYRVCRPYGVHTV